MKYNKSTVLSILGTLFSQDEAERLYEEQFKAVRSDARREELLSAITRKEGALRNSKENEMTAYPKYNIEDVTEVSEAIDFGYGVKFVVSATKVENQYGGATCDGMAVITCNNCEDSSIPVGESSGKTARHAINAATDWFYYREYLQENATVVEKGLRMNWTEEELEQFMADPLSYNEQGNIGIVNRLYDGELKGLKNKSFYWRQINVNFGRIKLTNVSMPEDKVLKQGFVDTILSGTKIEVHLQKVGWNWLITVLNNLTDPDRDAAWKRYQIQKSEAGATESAKDTERKTEAKIRKAEAEGDMDKVTELRERKSFINVVIGKRTVLHSFAPDMFVDGVEVPMLKTGVYQVVNTRGSVVKRQLNYTGMNSSMREFSGYASKGYSIRAL